MESTPEYVAMYEVLLEALKASETNTIAVVYPDIYVKLAKENIGLKAEIKRLKDIESSYNMRLSELLHLQDEAAHYKRQVELRNKDIDKLELKIQKQDEKIAKLKAEKEKAG